MTSVRRFGDPCYSALVKDLSGLLESARRAAARTVNAVMTTTNREIGHRIVEFEQRGEKRAEYGAELLETLAADLTKRFGRGFSTDNFESMRRFYRAFPPAKISETVSRNLPNLGFARQRQANPRRCLGFPTSSPGPRRFPCPGRTMSCSCVRRDPLRR
jgi:hypothetical protein